MTECNCQIPDDPDCPRHGNRATQHVFVTAGRKNGEFCSRCALHWQDDVHVTSSALGDS